MAVKSCAIAMSFIVLLFVVQKVTQKFSAITYLLQLTGVPVLTPLLPTSRFLDPKFAVKLWTASIKPNEHN